MVGRTLQRLEEDPSAFPLVERQALLLFPFATREDGACEQLGEDGRCRVYATRPLVCRVDMMAMARRMPRRGAWTTAAADLDRQLRPTSARRSSPNTSPPSRRTSVAPSV